jgi:hypothetical protein
MARLKLLSVALLSVLTVRSAEMALQVPNAEVPARVIDLSTLGYPTHPSENFSKTFGVPPTALAFADSEHLVVTFISSDPGTPSGREGRPADGTLIESITPHTNEYFSRITPSAEGHRFAFTGSSIRNTLEILEPHQTWEYVRRIHVYDLPTRSFVGDVKVSHSARNQDFPLALSPNGSTLAFLDGESLKVYRLPLAAESHP